MHLFHLVQVRRMIIEILPGLFAKMNENLPEKDRRSGGHFCMMETGGAMCFDLEIGKPPAEKQDSYLLRCLEKGVRLSYKNRFGGDKSAFLSRSPDENMYGGAICWNGFIFAFGGLPDLADEALMMRLLRDPRWDELECFEEITFYEIREIVGVTNNPHLDWIMNS